MKKWKRLILFWSMVCLFLVTVPVVLLRARGYRFDFHKGVFVYSGTITFKSNPQNANVHLNGISSPSNQLDRINSSYNITGLTPKTYNFQISADGFQTWNKNIDVHSGVASEFWNILLTRTDYERTTYDTSGIEKFFISPKNNLLAYITSSPKKITVKTFNIKNNENLDSFDFTGWNFAGVVRKENIEWSPGETAFSIPVKKMVEKETLYNYFIVNLEDKTTLDLNQFIGKADINNVRWDPKRKDYLFFLSENILYRANLKNQEDLISITSNVSAYDLSGPSVYYATLPNNLLFKNSLDGKNQPEQITNNFPNETGDEISNVIIYDDTRIAMITNNHAFYIFNKGEHDDYFRKINDGVLETHFSDDGKKILFWSNNEIFVYYLRDELSQPGRIENTLENITRYSKPVKNVQWLNDYEHIIFTIGSTAKVIELDPRDHQNCMDIVDMSIENPFVIYDSYLGNLFFTDTQNDSTILNSIIFPEATSILERIRIGG